jgi:pimeloyl-ACP methyl ester carboxylesterase
MIDTRAEHRNLLLASSDGTRIAAEHWFTGREEVVIVAPGFFQSKRTQTFRRIARFLRRRTDVILMDFRGHGDSGGAYHFSAKETDDLVCVARYAAAHHRRVRVLGFSYGGSIALLAQARERLFEGIACVGSPMRARDIEFEWWRRSSLRSGRRSLERGSGCRIGSIWSSKEAALDAVRRIGQTPLLFIHGSDDRIVYPRHSVRLRDAAAGPAEARIIPGGGHAEDLFRTHPELMSRILNDWLSGAGPGRS